MIPKELLSLILNDDITWISNDISDNNLTYEENYNDVQNRHINLDTLGRLCKEWCHEHNYNAFSCPKMVKASAGCQLYYRWNDGSISDEDLFFEADTELEAIIKAVEYILKDEKGKRETT